MPTEPLQPRVRLLSHTANPIETLYSCWQASRDNGPLIDPAALAPYRRDYPNNDMPDPSYDKLVEDCNATWQKVLAAGIPVAENIDFVFCLENVSISFREQMVRHRIGHHFGERLGCDIIPDLADSTFWSQSMRILDMSRFVSEGRFRVPDSISQSKATVVVNRGEHTVSIPVKDYYVEQLRWIQKAYRTLVNLGIPMEDARELIPLGATHRITWKTNLMALKHVMGKRGCWILQLGVWGPIIKGMVDELATKVDPSLRSLIAPPCIKGDEFTGCQFKLDNERRIQGEDEIPPCPLYLNGHPTEAGTACKKGGSWIPITVEGRPGTQRWDPSLARGAQDAEKARARLTTMERDYAELWGRDPRTGLKTASVSPG